MRERVMALQRWRRHGICLFVSLLVLANTAGCSVPGGSTGEHRAAPTQPPPAAVLASSLVATPWRLEQASSQGQQIAFDAAGPIYLTFGRAGGLEASSVPCGSGSYVVAYLGGRMLLITASRRRR